MALFIQQLRVLRGHLAGELLSFGDLGVGHVLDDDVSFSAFAAPLAAAIIPRIGDHVVLQHSNTKLIHPPKGNLNFALQFKDLPFFCW